MLDFVFHFCVNLSYPPYPFTAGLARYSRACPSQLGLPFTAGLTRYSRAEGILLSSADFKK